MEFQPLQNVGRRARREPADEPSVANPDTDSMACVRRMEVRRIVVVVQDRDGDSEKAAKLMTGTGRIGSE